MCCRDRSKNSKLLAFATVACYDLTMNLPATKTQKEISAIRTSLFRAVDSGDHGECRDIVRKAIHRIELLAKRLSNAPAELGKRGGQKTAERGPEFFARIAGMRKKRAGGRPPKESS